jgi:hypothetical protein
VHLCGAVRCGAVRCGAVRCGAVQAKRQAYDQEVELSLKALHASPEGPPAPPSPRHGHGSPRGSVAASQQAQQEAMAVTHELQFGELRATMERIGTLRRVSETPE